MAEVASRDDAHVDYGQFLQASSLIFGVADFEGNVLVASDAYARVLGYPAAEVRALPYLSLMHPDDLPAVREALARVQHGHEVTGFVCRMRTAAGDYRQIEWQATSKDDLLYTIGVDVSEREQAVSSARRNQVLHRRLFDVTTQGVVYHDHNGAIVDANPAAEEILGLSLAQMRGRDSRDTKWVAHREDGSPFPGSEHPALIALATRSEVRDVVMALRRPTDGAVRWLRIRAVPEIDPATGGVREVMVTFDDVTGVRAAQDKIETQNESLRAAVAEQTESRAQLDNVMAAVNRHAIVSVTDLKGRITAFNDNFVAISKYSPDELLGRTHRLINSGHHPKEFWAQMWATISAGQTWQGEVCNRAKDGTIYWVLSTIQPFRDAQGKVVQYVSIRTDITKQKAAELAAAEASQSKSRFLATMSHEIRTPLTAIIGLSHLADESGLDPGVAATIAQIRSSGEHLLAMLNDVLDFSKIEVSELVLRSDPIDPADVVAQAVAMHRTLARTRGLELDVVVGPGVPPAVLGDALRLRQVLLNLVSNAVKCTESGSVRVQLSAGAPAADGHIPLRFEVRDSGPGISRSDLRRIFDPFVQADSDFTRTVGGTGLGLAISSHLVTLMGGRLEAESQLGVGSVFGFTLPLQPVAPELVTDRRAEVGEVSRLTGRVLLVEDNMVNRTIATQMLSRAGLTVSTANNGAEAIAAFQGGQVPVDVVLMDIHMPIVDGWEATRQIRALPTGKAVPIIALTANALTGDREACLAAGMDDHLAKPFDPGGLISTLARWLPSPQLRQSDSEAGPGASLVQSSQAADGWAPPPVDRLAGLRAVDGDVELYCELLGMFTDDMPSRADMLADAVAAGDAAQVRSVAHFIKGSALALGATAVGATSAELEAAAAKGDVDPGLCERMLAEVRAALTAIPALVAELSGAADAGAQPISALVELEECLRASEWIPPDLLSRTRDELVERGVPTPMASELLAAVESYDFRRGLAALAMISDLAEAGGGI